MAKLGAAAIIAVDVAPQEHQELFYNYGNKLSGWWLLWNRLNPFSTTARVPSMGEISTALMWCSSERHLERVRESPRVDLYLRPPVEKYGTLEYDKYDEIVEAGYRHAKAQIQHHLDVVRQVDEEAAGKGV